jgi:hypothetical protein
MKEVKNCLLKRKVFCQETEKQKDFRKLNDVPENVLLKIEVRKTVTDVAKILK